jgi:hypothetical protein
MICIQVLIEYNLAKAGYFAKGYHICRQVTLTEEPRSNKNTFLEVVLYLMQKQYFSQAGSGAFSEII